MNVTLFTMYRFEPYLGSCACYHVIHSNSKQQLLCRYVLWLEKNLNYSKIEKWPKYCLKNIRKQNACKYYIQHKVQFTLIFLSRKVWKCMPMTADLQRFFLNNLLNHAKSNSQCMDLCIAQLMLPLPPPITHQKFLEKTTCTLTSLWMGESVKVCKRAFVRVGM